MQRTPRLNAERRRAARRLLSTRKRQDHRRREALKTCNDSRTYAGTVAALLRNGRASARASSGRHVLASAAFFGAVLGLR